MSFLCSRASAVRILLENTSCLFVSLRWCTIASGADVHLHVSDIRAESWLCEMLALGLLLHFATSHTGWRRDLLEVDRCIPSFASGHEDKWRRKGVKLTAMGAHSDRCEFASDTPRACEMIVCAQERRETRVFLFRFVSHRQALLVPRSMLG